ncbi:MAG: DUF1587 domain-containing protein, partial [Vicinamibacterales bacterium]
MRISASRLVLAGWAVTATVAVSTAPAGAPKPQSPVAPVARTATSSRPAAPAAPPTLAAPPSAAFVDTYCATCHNQRLKTAGFSFHTLDRTDVAAHPREWEKVVVKLRAGLMPPAGVARPEQAVIDAFAASVESALDQAARARPNPGRTEPFHRLNRVEYRNAVRDLLGLDIDAKALLPHDEVSYGFDNIAGVLKLSPLLTERYLGAAQKVARLAVGTPAPPGGELYRMSEQLDQDVRLDGMPVGTRGGTRVDYMAPRDGEYVIKARLGRGVDYDIPHFLGEQNLELSIDGERIQVFTLAATPEEDLNIERQVYRAPGTQVARPLPQNDAPQPSQTDLVLARRQLDDNWEVRVPLRAGVHEIRATFLTKTAA